MAKTTVKKPKGSPIIINDGDSKRLIGYYEVESNTFRCNRSKEQHFMRKNQSWGLDKKVVDYLSIQDATVVLTDKDNKWKYQVKAREFKVYGELFEFKEHGEQYFLGIDHWQILRAKDRSHVVKCYNTYCRHCFATNCLLGGIIISDDGGCKNYESK